MIADADLDLAIRTGVGVRCVIGERVVGRVLCENVAAKRFEIVTIAVERSAGLLHDGAGSAFDVERSAARELCDSGATYLSLRFRQDSLEHYLDQLEAMNELASTW